MSDKSRELVFVKESLYVSDISGNIQLIHASPEAGLIPDVRVCVCVFLVGSHGQSRLEISTGRAALRWNNSWDLNRPYITGRPSGHSLAGSSQVHG